jgi:hypothetical protein
VACSSGDVIVMIAERRGAHALGGCSQNPTGIQEEILNKTKPFIISKDLVMQAFKLRKFKRFKGHKTRTAIFLEGLLEKQPDLFAHWECGLTGGFD